MGWVVVGVNDGLYRFFASVPQVAITQWEWTAAGGRVTRKVLRHAPPAEAAAPLGHPP